MVTVVDRGYCFAWVWKLGKDKELGCFFCQDEVNINIKVLNACTLIKKINDGNGRRYYDII